MIQLRRISKDFRLGEQTVHALKEINLDIKQGEYVSVMGPSGSGKSTLLNLIALLDSPSAGDYFLNDQNVPRLPDDDLALIRRKNIGFVFQFFHLIPRLTASENIELPLTLAGIAPHERQNTIEKAIKSFGLVDRADHRPDQLSGGERQRVAIARATIMQPTVLLADEPTGNLDHATGNQVIDLLEQLNAQGVTLIVVTHNPEIGNRAARQIKIVDGKITEDVCTETA